MPTCQITIILIWITINRSCITRAGEGGQNLGGRRGRAMEFGKEGILILQKKHPGCWDDYISHNRHLLVLVEINLLSTTTRMTIIRRHNISTKNKWDRCTDRKASASRDQDDQLTKIIYKHTLLKKRRKKDAEEARWEFFSFKFVLNLRHQFILQAGFVGILRWGLGW